ncbi:Retrovirus-related Pol polyprotein from transposon TNT 1-94 [Linum grandiflorum]
MKDLGSVDVILGIKATKLDRGYCLHQAHYTEKILRKFNCFDVFAARTPYDSSIHLSKNAREAVSQFEYAHVIGSFMFLMNCTRPYIGFAVNHLSRYTHNPGGQHLMALNRVLRYLRGTMNVGLHYNGYPLLEGFTNANWVTDSDEANSTSGFVFTRGAAISWKSAK